jgi:hypothetical protein
MFVQCNKTYPYEDIGELFRVHVLGLGLLKPLHYGVLFLLILLLSSQPD